MELLLISVFILCGVALCILPWLPVVWLCWGFSMVLARNNADFLYVAMALLVATNGAMKITVPLAHWWFLDTMPRLYHPLLDYWLDWRNKPPSRQPPPKPSPREIEWRYQGEVMHGYHAD